VNEVPTRRKLNFRTNSGIANDHLPAPVTLRFSLHREVLLRAGLTHHLDITDLQLSGFRVVFGDSGRMRHAFRAFFHAMSSGIGDGSGDRDGVSHVVRQRNVSAGEVPGAAILSLQLEVISLVGFLQASSNRVGSGFVLRSARVFLCHRQSQTEASKQQTKHQRLHVSAS